MSLNVYFYIRRYKLTSQKKCPIFLRITVNGIRAEIALKRTVSPDSWDSKRQAVRGKNAEAASINEQIRVFEMRIYEEYNKLVGRGEYISANKIKAAFLGLDRLQQTVVTAFQYHNKRIEAQVGKQFAKGTYERYVICLRLLQEFMEYKYGKSDFYLNEIELGYISDFDFYLRTVRNCSNNTTVKYLKNFKKIINLAKDMGWIANDPFVNYKAKLEEIDKEILTQEELDILLIKELKIPRIDAVRDVFIFCCLTGLAYSDVKKLANENVFKGVDGNKWIQVSRTKTNVLAKIPLSPIALQIIDKYKEHPICLKSNRLLPVLSNQKFNVYLKELGDCCGIHKNLTSHTARHTFATTVTLNHRVPIEIVSKMLGHKSLKTTQHYSRIVEVKIADDMAQVLKKFDYNRLNKGG